MSRRSAYALRPTRRQQIFGRGVDENKNPGDSRWTYGRFTRLAAKRASTIGIESATNKSLGDNALCKASRSRHPAASTSMARVQTVSHGGVVTGAGMQLRSMAARNHQDMKILVADDDPLTRCLLQETLEHAGYEVIAVEDGRAAPECLSRKDGPRLAHLDWLMPEVNGLIIGFEALVRWQRPEFGLVMPGGFISAAEDTGLILWIGHWILEQACRQICAWNLQFPCSPPFTVAVNVSAKQFAQKDLVSQVGEILRDSGLAPDRLKLEPTESVTMRDEERTTRILSELKALGVRLCIDDFGIGYSSLSYLRRFALDVLKIDRSFVSEMLNNSESPEIVKTILSLGSNLGMEVVAEGVETPEQVSRLKALGCDFAQGYFFSRPLDSAGVVCTLVNSEPNYYTLPQESPGQLVAPVR